MKHKLLVSGDRTSFTTLLFDSDQGTLSVLADYPAPFNASWIEPWSTHDDVDCLIGLSEGTESGLLYSFEIDHARNICKITSQRQTLGAPGHFTTLRDRSVQALGTYLGGSVALYPIHITEKNRVILPDVPRTELFPDFAYKTHGHGPDKVRQRQCHIHQILEDKQGLLYAPDLGSDLIWILCRCGMKLDICGWLQCPPGTGARHAVFNHDETIIYVIGELSHTVVAFDLSAGATGDVQAIDGFAPNIIPTTVHPDHQNMMDSAEICIHPKIPNVLYVSNRWVRHIATREPHLKDVPKDLPLGDDVAIILLSKDGKKVEKLKHVQTNVDVIRGMRLSDDGKYVAVAGQEGGGIEIYEISGDAGDAWTLRASLNEGLETGLKHAVWLQQGNTGSQTCLIHL